MRTLRGFPGRVGTYQAELDRGHFNAIREADTIAVLNGGTITEHGDHDTLMALDGDYARLFRLQASGYQEATR